MKSVDLLTTDEVHSLCRIKNQHWAYGMDSQLEWWRENSDQNDLVVCALTDDRITGFLRLRDRDILVRSYEIKAKCVTEVCVDKELLGQGIGKKIMKKASNFLLYEELGGYLLCNNNEVGFYESCGWLKYTEVGVRKNANAPVLQLKNGINCLLFYKKLSEPIVITGLVF